MDPTFVRIMWLPFCRRRTQPALIRAVQACLPEMTGSSGNGDVDLDRADGEWQSLLGADLEALDDRLADVGQGLLLGLALAHAPRDRRAFRDDHARLVALERDGQLHGDPAGLQDTRPTGRGRFGRAGGLLAVLE